MNFEIFCHHKVSYSVLFCSAHRKYAGHASRRRVVDFMTTPTKPKKKQQTMSSTSHLRAENVFDLSPTRVQTKFVIGGHSICG